MHIPSMCVKLVLKVTHLDKAMHAVFSKDNSKRYMFIALPMMQIHFSHMWLQNRPPA